MTLYIRVMGNVLPLVAAATALLAVLVGPLVMMYVARRQAHLQAIVLVRVET